MPDPEEFADGKAENEEFTDEESSDDSASAEPDLKTILARLDEIDKERKLTRAELNHLKSTAGRISAYQAKVDKLEKAGHGDDPRVAELEDTIDMLLDDLSDSMSDAAKNRMASKRTERQRRQFKEEIRREIAPKQEEEPALDEWGQTTLELLEIMREKGIDPEDERIKNAWNPANTGGQPDRSPRAGYARMMRIIEKIEAGDDEEPPAAKGKRNAGAGQPASTGAGIGSFKSRAAVEKAFYEGKIDAAQWRSIRRGPKWAALPES